MLGNVNTYKLVAKTACMVHTSQSNHFNILDLYYHDCVSQSNPKS